MARNLLLVLAVFLVGCSSEKPAPVASPSATAEVAAPEPQPAVSEKTATIPAEWSPAPLTAEQIARNKVITLAVEEIRIAHEGGANKNLPKWVADHYRAFERDDYTRDKVAFQRSVGWGTGLYKGRSFYWFAHTNTDAHLQFDFSVAMTADDLGSLGVSRGQGSLYEVHLADGSDWFIPGTVTWIGVNYDWIDTDCVLPDYQPCNIGWVLEKAVADLNKEPSLKLTIKGKFPW